MKLLVTGAWKVSQEQLNKVSDLGCQVVFMQQEKDALPCAPEQIDGVVCNGLFLYHDIKAFTNLKFIQLTSVGFDRVPMNVANKMGIAVFNAGRTYSIPMAEFVLTGVLSLYKKMEIFFQNKKAKQWLKDRNLLELYGKSVLIVGCGNVGKECAKRFNAFGCRVKGVDLYPREDESFISMEGMDKLDNNLKNADIVVLTLPLTKETTYLFNQKRFAVMKKDSLLVNVARGAIIEEGALVNALENKLMGAVVDVFETEPLSENSPLWAMKNVVLTPHNSFVGDGNEQRLFELIIKNLKEQL